MSSSFDSFWYQNISKARRCSSIGRFPILQPPGNGIDKERKRFRIAGKRNTHTRIFLIASVSRFSRLIWVVSSVTVLPSNQTTTPSDSIMERNVKTSPIRGTFSRVNFWKNRPQAMRGSAAFLDQDISTTQERSCGQRIESIRKNNMPYSIRR